MSSAYRIALLIYQEMEDRCTEARVVKAVGLYTRAQQIDSKNVWWFKDKREGVDFGGRERQKQGGAIHVKE